MTVEEMPSEFETLGNEKMRAQNARNGTADNQHAVRLGEMRKLAKMIKTNHELAVALWETGNIDARLLAILLIKKKALSSDELDRIVRSVTLTQMAVWPNS